MNHPTRLAIGFFALLLTTLQAQAFDLAELALRRGLSAQSFPPLQGIKNGKQGKPCEIGLQYSETYTTYDSARGGKVDPPIVNRSVLLSAHVPYNGPDGKASRDGALCFIHDEDGFNAPSYTCDVEAGPFSTRVLTAKVDSQSKLLIITIQEKLGPLTIAKFSCSTTLANIVPISPQPSSASCSTCAPSALKSSLP